MINRLAAIVMVLLGAAASSGCAKKDDASGCSPGRTQPCYDGPAGTLGIGTCMSGLSTCTEAREWGACAGAVGPQADVCGNFFDEDCNGTPDDVVDPSRYDFYNDGAVDNDCDGFNGTAPCDGGLPNNSDDPFVFAKAIELCAVSTTSATTGYGVIRAGFSLADGTGSPSSDQHSMRYAFGPFAGFNTRTPGGVILAAFSTGVSSAPGLPSPFYSGVVPGTSHGATSGYPADWFATNSNIVPTAPGCPAIAGNPIDPILYTVEIRVPSNAHAIAFDAIFMTADYPEFVCSPFTDVFVALLDSSYTGPNPNPADKNIARTGTPISANCVASSDCPFFVCKNGPTGCGTGAVPSNYTACYGPGLPGTGFDVEDNACAVGDQIGGATTWFRSAGNVVPGEIITLRFGIWDSGDGTLDSHVLLDNVHWLPATITPGIQ